MSEIDKYIERKREEKLKTKSGQGGLETLPDLQAQTCSQGIFVLMEVRTCTHSNFYTHTDTH